MLDTAYIELYTRHAFLCVLWWLDLSIYFKVTLLPLRESHDSPCASACTWGPFYRHILNLVPAWISNHMFSEVWGGITYLFPIFKIKPFSTKMCITMPFTKHRPFCSGLYLITEASIFCISHMGGRSYQVLIYFQFPWNGKSLGEAISER